VRSCFASFLLVAFLTGAAGAVEISFKRGGQGEGTRVGFVDMQRIYREYPETQKARAEYNRELARYKAELTDRERALEDLKLRPTASPVASTDTVAVATAPAVPAGADEVERARADLEKARADAAAALRDFESKQSARILGQLHKALVALATERGVAVVVDKASILYGENAVDLTEALHRKVRGIPEPSR
jgi:Skp family chaperone for outer membrane proteins